jgi:hypothetical protein
MRLSWWQNLSTSALCVAALVLTTAGALRAENDKVTKFRGDPVQGKVNKADLDGVEIEVRDPRMPTAAKLTLGAAEISGIEWDVNDPEFRAGMGAFDAGQYAQAAQRFEGIVKDK